MIPVEEIREGVPVTLESLRVRAGTPSLSFAQNSSERTKVSDGFWDGSTSSSDLDIAAFLDSSVVERLGQLLDLGVLVSLGLTRDRGAIGISVFDDGKRRREYFRTATDACDFMGSARDALSGNGLGEPAGTRSSRQKPTRGA